MTPSALVTGAGGFVATHLCAAMIDAGWEVAGVALPGQTVPHGVAPYFGDVADREVVARALAAIRPQYVVHLAAQSSVAASAAGSGAAATLAANVGSAAAVVDAVAAAGGIRLLLVGSAEEYGARDAADGPIGEDAPLCPLSAYASSKVCQEIIAGQYVRSAQLDVVLTRSFNHTGPGQAGHFLVPSLVARARALPREGGTLVIGNAEVVRDFLHVADVAAAYVALLRSGVSGAAYNVCSGTGVTVREIAETVLRELGVRAAIVSDPALRRTADTPFLVGSHARLTKDTGWSPQRSLVEAITAVARSEPSSRAIPST